jgi:hypothetical protein
MAFIIILLWIVAVVMCLWHAINFSNGHTYCIRSRREAHHGRKLLFWAGVLIIMYYFPYEGCHIF